MKIILFANTDWYLYNFRRSLALLLVELGHDVILISPDTGYGKRLVELGLDWRRLSMERRSLNPIRELFLVHGLVKLMRQEQPDLVHGFTVKSAIYGSLAARVSGVPFRVSAVAGLGYVFSSSHFVARVLRPIVRLLFRISLGGRGSRLILQNPDDVKKFRKLRMIAPESIRLIYGSGVDLARFSPRQELRPSGPVRVLLPARLLWDKGVAEFVEAANVLKKRGVEAEFLLAGQPDHGNPGAVPESILKGWVRDGLVSWLGHVEEMPELLRSVDIVALPTSYGEGVPRSLIEAGASGCALIATDVPGCREIVRNGVNGLIVPPGNGLALAEAIESLIKNPELRSQFGAASLEIVMNTFDEKIVLERTLGVYRELQECSQEP